jgi:hypothetical protein
MAIENCALKGIEHDNADAGPGGLDPAMGFQSPHGLEILQRLDPSLDQPGRALGAQVPELGCRPLRQARTPGSRVVGAAAHRGVFAEAGNPPDPVLIFPQSRRRAD